MSNNKGEEKNLLQVDEDYPLVRLCQKGDMDAFEALVEKHQKKMLNIAYRMIGSYEEACEVVQDTFLSAYKAIRKFRGESRFSTWLSSIVINLSKNRLKQMKVRFHREGPSLNDPVQTKDGRLRIEPPAYEPSIAEHLEKREVQARVHECINHLDAEYREVLVLRDIQGFSYEEIRDILKIPDGTIKSRLFRARDALKDRLKKAFGGL
jgi:RNA polymerase sigma-70 factor (ECF subfamily)